MPCFETAPSLASRTIDFDPCEADMTALRSPGRPKDLEKREAILNAAQSLFAERGIDGVAIEAIAARSGVSKVTVYGHFGDKGRIFDSIVQRETDRLKEALDKTSLCRGNLQDALTRFGIALVTMLSQPCHLALDRAVSLEAQRNPELGRRFFAAGPGQVRDMLSDLIAQAHADGHLKVDDPTYAAEDLMALWLGFDAMERRFCGGCVPEENGLTQHIARSVRLFLRAHAPD